VEHPGGIQRYARKLICALRDLLGSSNVRSIALSEPHSNGQAKSRVPLSARYNFARQAIWEAFYWSPDITICTHVSLSPISWFTKRFTGQPYWIVVHGIEVWRDLPLLRRVALAQADRVVVTSAYSQEQIVRLHGINSERLVTLPCMLDEALVGVEPAKIDRSRYAADDQRVILTVARMNSKERYKGHDVVLRALPSVLAEIPNLTYIIVGGGDDRPRLQRLAAELDVSNRVVFAGEVGDSELAALYLRSEIFVLPARTVINSCDPKGEGFGIVFLEAMAFGKPVIGPNYGAPAELIRDRENGLLVDPQDPMAVKEALLELLTKPELGRAMGSAASEWVRKYYSSGCFRERLRDTLVA
jgi:phosphatidyl-myo-inositol dimannoside synthase